MTLLQTFLIRNDNLAEDRGMVAERHVNVRETL